jgi:hypothetical protein
MAVDKRRYHPIELEQINEATFHLLIGGVMWSEVEWSSSKRVWCIQDAAGHCLLHCEHIVGQDIDQRTAIAIAKQMIRDGRMPSPEEALGTLQVSEADREASEEASELGEPMARLEDPAAVPVKR